MNKPSSHEVVVPLRFGSIDIGSVAVQHLIADLRGPEDFTVLEGQADITLLGDGVDLTNELSEEAQRRTLVRLRFCAQRFRALSVNEALVVGTSALRDAHNQAAFARRVFAETGLTVRVLTGEAEARYSFLSASRAFDWGERLTVVMDLGGGSTEFMWGAGDVLIGWISLQLGSIRLTDRFVSSDPVTEREYQAIHAHIDSELRACHLPSNTEVLIGMAGTFHNLSAVAQGRYSPEMVHGSLVTRSDIQSQVRRYRECSVADRRSIPGLDPRRADFILAGAMLAERAMDRLGVERVQISDHGVMYERLGAFQ
jgi:exopolyphosphatase/guanosine-5'-triphosphate,3'-diphosphate pyrophosphatase